MECLRALLSVNDNYEDIKKTLIEVYYEYNVLLPEELSPQAIKINSIIFFDLRINRI